MKDKMYWTFKEMILFRLLQQGECSLRRTFSEKSKGAGVLWRQVNKGAILRSYGNHEKRWRWILSESLRKGRGGSYLPTIPTFWEHKTQIEFNIANVKK